VRRAKRVRGRKLSAPLIIEEKFLFFSPAVAVVVVVPFVAVAVVGSGEFANGGGA